ncbi:hypothetical protein Pjdr2_1532 [Paenibacillus sp. JDR-2]|nr:hypothetical protein Pjdr2_1532 [Paenibacillus sp. JDR-2]
MIDSVEMSVLLFCLSGAIAQLGERMSRKHYHQIGCSRNNCIVNIAVNVKASSEAFFAFLCRTNALYS